jgi:hypothetical protein
LSTFLQNIIETPEVCRHVFYETLLKHTRLIEKCFMLASELLNNILIFFKYFFKTTIGFRKIHVVDTKGYEIGTHIHTHTLSPV